MNRVASHAQFNGLNLLTGRFARETGENVVAGSMWLHIGANMDQRERLYIGTMTAQGLGIQSADGLPHSATFISLSTPDSANMAISIVDSALNQVVIRTSPGGAHPVALALDKGFVDDIVGTIAGDDTILVIMRSVEEAEVFRRKFLDYIG